MSFDIIITVTNDLNYDQRMIRIANTLYDNGYKVCLIGRKKKNSAELIKQKFYQHRINCFFQKGKWFYLEFNLRLFFKLLFLKKKLVISVDLDTLLAHGFARYFSYSKWIYDAHEFFTEVPELVGRKKEKRIWSMIASYFIPKIDVCWVSTETIRQLFKYEYNLASVLVRNFQLASFNNNDAINVKENIIVYQGMLNKGRGLAELITAMKQINAKLIIVGSGDIENELKALVVQENLESKVEFKGLLIPIALKKITNSAKIGVNILENSGLNYYGSLANKWSDYIQANIPQVNMNFPEYVFLNQEIEVSLLINSLAIDQIVYAINSLLLNNIEYDKLVLNTKQAAKIFNWENESIKILKSVQKLGIKPV